MAPPRLLLGLTAAKQSGETVFIREAKACLLEGQPQLRFGGAMHTMPLPLVILDGAAGDERLSHQIVLRPSQIASCRATERRRKNTEL